MGNETDSGCLVLILQGRLLTHNDPMNCFATTMSNVHLRLTWRKNYGKSVKIFQSH